MKLWKTKTWTPLDIGCLKWSSLLIGIVIGTLLAEVAKPYIWILLTVAVVLAIMPTIHYFQDGK